MIVALDEPPSRPVLQTADSRTFKDKWRVQIQGCRRAVRHHYVDCHAVVDGL